MDGETKKGCMADSKVKRSASKSFEGSIREAR